MNEVIPWPDRKKYFIFGCIPTRLLIAASCLYVSKKFLVAQAAIMLTIAITFLTLWIFNLRLNASEGGGKTWWHGYRFPHGILYLIASFALFTNNRMVAFGALLVDTLLGIHAFMENYDYYNKLSQ